MGRWRGQLWGNVLVYYKKPIFLAEYKYERMDRQILTGSTLGLKCTLTTQQQQLVTWFVNMSTDKLSNVWPVNNSSKILNTKYQNVSFSWILNTGNQNMAFSRQFNFWLCLTKSAIKMARCFWQHSTWFGAVTKGVVGLCPLEVARGYYLWLCLSIEPVKICLQTSNWILVSVSLCTCS